MNNVIKGHGLSLPLALTKSPCAQEDLLVDPDVSPYHRLVFSLCQEKRLFLSHSALLRKNNIVIIINHKHFLQEDRRFSAVANSQLVAGET